MPQISINGNTYPIEKMEDATHFLMSGRAYHVGEYQIRFPEMSKDLYEWLSGRMSDSEIEAKKY